MGLSNEERAVKIYYTIQQMVESAGNLKGYDPNYKLLKRTCDKAWHYFLGNQTNSSHWLVGSSSEEIIKHGDCSPWAVAINQKISALLPSESEQIDNFSQFNAFDGFLNIHGLIRGESYTRDSKALAEVFKIYQHSERLIYSLRRYDDEFLRGFKKLDKLISDIQGICFYFFDSEEIFARAYVLHNTLSLIYGSTFYSEDDDFVTRWLSKHCMHHSLSVAMQEDSLDFESLAKIHRDLTESWIKAGKKSVTIQYERVISALRLAGRRFHYKHQHSELIKMAKDAKFFNSKQIKEIEDLCKKNTELASDYEKKNSERYKENSKGEALDVYGHTKLDKKD